MRSQGWQRRASVSVTSRASPWHRASSPQTPPEHDDRDQDRVGGSHEDDASERRVPPAS
jgi:hypothetical protein